MSSLHNSSADLLAALAILAPEENARVALVSLIEFMEDCDDETLFNRQLVLEIVARGIVDCGWRVRADETDGIEDFADLEHTEIIQHFRRELGMEDDG